MAHDHIKTKLYRGEIKPGTILRATGNGSQLLRVRSINPDGTGTVETYATLHYGSLIFPKRNFYIRPCEIKQRGDHPFYDHGYVNVESNGYHRTWLYKPVEIYSVFYDPLDAFEMGRSYAKNQVRDIQKRVASCSSYSIHAWDPKLKQTVPITYSKHIRSSGEYANPFKGSHIEQAWVDGVNNYMDNQQEV